MTVAYKHGTPLRRSGEGQGATMRVRAGALTRGEVTAVDHGAADALTTAAHPGGLAIGDAGVASSARATVRKVSALVTEAGTIGVSTMSAADDGTTKVELAADFGEQGVLVEAIVEANAACTAGALLVASSVGGYGCFRAASVEPSPVAFARLETAATTAPDGTFGTHASLVRRWVQLFPHGVATGLEQAGTVTNADLATDVAARLLGAGSGADTFIVNHADNAADGSATVFIGGGGSASFPNLVGDTGKPAGADFAPGDWDDDASYVADSADVATIGGGYDNVNNQLAGTICGGGHNFLMGGLGQGQASVNGHSTIVGGSYNIISGGRSFIGAGRRNSIDSDTLFGCIVGGDDNELIDGDYSTIGGGAANEVSGSYSCVLGGLTNTVSGDYASALGGQLNTVSGHYSVAAGESNTVAGSHSGVFGTTNTAGANADYALLAGSNNNVNHAYGITAGRHAVPLGSEALTIGRSNLVEVGDAQLATRVLAARTTDATATNLLGSGSSFWAFEAGKSSAFTGKVMLIGMRDGSADGNNDGNYAQGSWQLEFGGYWDGTNGLFYDAAGTTASGTGPVRALTVIRDNITAGTIELRLSTGGLRVNVTGVAATIINWVARMDFVMTKVS